MELNLLDAALQKNSPAVMVPRYEALAPLDRNGHRYLVASNGLWLELLRPWARIVWPIALTNLQAPLPFGNLDKTVEIRFAELPTDLLLDFISVARRASPVEVAAVIFWNHLTGSFRLAHCRAIQSGVGHIKANWPQPLAGECLVMDIHSHGPIAAYFSRVDKRDMGTDAVLACVVGNLDMPIPTMALSLFAGGVEIPVRIPSGLPVQGRRKPPTTRVWDFPVEDEVGA